MALLMPAFAYAQTAQNIINIVDIVALILNRMVGIFIIIALMWFIWGLYEYIESESKDPGKRKNGIERMVMGTVAFFVIVSIWGLVRFLQNSLGIQGSSSNLRNEEIPFVGGQVQR
ncbi:MAG: hypothetical protein A2542_02105 [Parcubacteria group bacterium RIFOXYD2_FULL_52_8]|nr:MAG: hypothetical protein A2542_02105 [Parcubacteria group bacterium RIFOXYD2_FULL_52_8]